MHWIEVVESFVCVIPPVAIKLLSFVCYLLSYISVDFIVLQRIDIDWLINLCLWFSMSMSDVLDWIPDSVHTLRGWWIMVHSSKELKTIKENFSCLQSNNTSPLNSFLQTTRREYRIRPHTTLFIYCGAASPSGVQKRVGRPKGGGVTCIKHTPE